MRCNHKYLSRRSPSPSPSGIQLINYRIFDVCACACPSFTALETEHLLQYPPSGMSLHKHKKCFIRGTPLKTPSSTSFAHDQPVRTPMLTGCLIASLKKHLVQWPPSAKKQIKWLQCLHLGSHLATLFSLSFQLDLRERDQQISTNSHTLLLLQVVVHGNQHFA
jgi:hypothetical protein